MRIGCSTVARSGNRRAGGCAPRGTITPLCGQVDRTGGRKAEYPIRKRCRQRVVGWARVGVDTDGTDGTAIREKSLKARVLGIFREYLFHLFHLFHAPRREKKPRAVLGGREARLAVRGAIIPNCDHARKVGERLSSMEWQRAFRDYSQRALHSSEARLLQRAN